MNSINTFLENNHPNIIQLLQELIRIPSYKQPPTAQAPFGEGCRLALQHMLTAAQKMDFSVTNLDNYIGYADYGTSETCFGILGHLDVVPAGTDWMYAPYGAEIHDNKLYGRGAMDDKGPMVASLFALYAIKECNIPLQRRVRLLFGTDEESGWADIAHYKKYEKLPDIAISPDGEYPLVNAERGIVHLRLQGSLSSSSSAVVQSIHAGTVVNVIAGRSEATLLHVAKTDIERECRRIQAKTPDLQYEIVEQHDTVMVTLIGKSAHASTPQEGMNSLCALFDLLAHLSIDPQQHELFDTLHHYFPLGDFHGTALGIDCEDEKMGRITCGFTIFTFENGAYQGDIDIRFPLCTNTNDIQAQFNACGIETEVTSQQAPHYVSPDSELVQSLLSVYEEQTGKKGRCLTIGGGTYSRAIENAVTFGCEFPGNDSQIHQANEFIDLDELLLNAKIMAHAILAICQ